MHSYGFDLFSVLLNMEAGDLFKEKATGGSSSGGSGSGSGARMANWSTMRKVRKHLI